MFTIAYDTELMRPGCANVQRALGGTIPNADLHDLDTELWLTAPTPAMGVYPITSPEQFEQLRAQQSAFHEARGVSKRHPSQ